MTHHILADKLLNFASQLTATERDNLKLLLGEAAGGLAPKEFCLLKGQEAQAFRVVVQCLAHLQPHSSRVPPGGIAWRGRPTFLTDSLLADLQIEATCKRKQAVKEGSYMLGCGGTIADKIATDQEVVDFVTSQAGPVSPTGVASYLFYDESGQGLDPHVDTDVFSLNMILMLRHDYGGVDPARLIIYSADMQAQYLLLKPGEAVLLFADSVVHAREAIKPGEAVTLLTIGFQPQIA